MAGKILSSDEKTKLVFALPSIKFLNEDVVKSYRCMMCDDVAIYHYFATCHHLFCGKCHGIYASKPCPIDKCENKSLAEVSQSMDQEMGVYNLKASCMFKNNGCEEVVTLSGIMDHQRKCKFSTRNLLPVVWTPKEHVDAREFDKMMDDLSELKKVVAALQEKKCTCNCQHAENDIRREIEELKSNFDDKFNSVQAIQKIHDTDKKYAIQIQDHKQNADHTMETKVNDICQKIEQDIIKSSKNQEDKLKNHLEKTLKTQITDLHRGHSVALQVLHGDLTTYMHSDVSQQLFPDLTIQVMSQRIQNIFEYFKEQKSQDFIWKIEGITKKLIDLESGQKDTIGSGYFKAAGSDIKQAVKMVYDLEKDTFEIWSDVRTWFDDIPGQYQNHFQNYQYEICLLDQSDAKVKKDIWITDDYFLWKSKYLKFEKCYGRIPTKCMKNVSRYVKYDSIKIIIRSLPYTLLYKSFYSNNGTLFWKLHDFKQRKQDGLNGVADKVLSECFCSTEMGYRMQISVTFEETRALFQLCYRRGEHDESLSKESAHKVTTMIFDQSESKEKRHLSKIISCDKIKFSRIFEFVYAIHENPRYLKNDCLLIKVIVENRV